MDETTAADVRAAMREASAAFLDTDMNAGGLIEAAYTLASGFRDLDTGTVLTGNGRRVFTEDATPQTVYVLRYSHYHGDDIDVYATSEAASAAAADLARQFWGKAAGTMNAPDDFPDSPDGLSDQDATRMYFNVLDGVEWYEITASAVRDA